MDDFMLLDRQATGETAKFVIHQGAICTDFAEMLAPVALSVNSEYFNTIRADFVGHSVEIPNNNESVVGTLDIEPEVLLEKITDDQFEKLTKTIPTLFASFIDIMMTGGNKFSQAGVNNLL